MRVPGQAVASLYGRTQDHVFCQGAAARYTLMTMLRRHYPLAGMCRVLGVSRSGYHAWAHRRPSMRAQDHARLDVEIQAAHVRTLESYGPGRLQTELRDEGFPANVGRSKCLRRKLGLRGKQQRPFTRTQIRISACLWPQAGLGRRLTPVAPPRPGAPTSPLCAPMEPGCIPYC